MTQDLADRPMLALMGGAALLLAVGFVVTLMHPLYLSRLSLPMGWLPARA